MITEAAKKDTFDTLEPVKNEYEQSLGIANKLVRTAAANAGTTDTIGPQLPGATNILDTAPAKDIPQDIQSLPGVLQVFKDAKAKGSISETDYWGRTSAILKDIRSRYPVGYRDVIDAEASKILGGDPANKHIAGLLSDINSFITGGQQQTNHILNELSTSGFPGADVVYQKLRAGQVDVDYAVRFMAPFRERKYGLQMNDLDLDNAKKRGEANETWYRNNMRAHFQAATQDVLTAVNYNTGITDFQSLQQAVIDGYSGKRKYSEPQYEQLGNLALAYKAQAAAKMREKAAQLVSTGAISQDAANKEMDESLRVFDDMHKAFSNKDVGLAYDSIRYVQGVERAAKLNLVNSTIGPASVKWGAFRSIVGEGLAEKIGLEEAFQKLRPEFGAYLKEYKMDAMMPPDLRNVKQFNSAKDMFDDLGNRRDKSIPAVEIPKIVDGVLNIVDGPNGFVGKDTPDAVKEQIFKHYFSPANWGMLRNVAEDVFDPTKNNGRGAWIPGKQALFTRLTHPDVVSEVEKISQKNPEYRKMYDDFIKTTVEKDLLPNDIAKLKEMSIGGLSGEAWKIKYTSGTGQFEVIGQGGDSFMRRGRSTLTGNEGQVSDIIRRINSVTSSLKNVAEGSKQDVDAYVLRILLDATGTGTVNAEGKVTGFDVNKIEGMPKNLVQAVINSRDKALEEAKKLKETQKKYRP